MLIVFLSTWQLSLFAQPWLYGSDSTNNFHETQAKFNNFWSNRNVTKGKGHKQFKRWEYFMESRVGKDGSYFAPSILFKEHKKHTQNQQAKRNSLAKADWEILGPTSIPNSIYSGIGRVNCVAIDPNDDNTLYVGAPAGGFWKTTDGGNNWHTTTDSIPSIGVASIAIDPSNSDILYIATGDIDGSDTYSIGLLKSTDKGETWKTTGLNWEIDDFIKVAKIIIDPSESESLVAATNIGIYKSTDGGDTWTKSVYGDFKDLEIKPTDFSVQYASTYSMSSGLARFYKSTDAGKNWTQTTIGLPTSNASRIGIAVTPDNADAVYLAIATGSDHGFKGFYTSEDQGNSFNIVSTNKNLFGWDESGLDQGGQAWYDLSIDVSPTDDQHIIVGAVNLWETKDKGNTWNIIGHWIGSGGVYVHADHHFIKFQQNSSNIVYTCTDGGIYKSTNGGASWNNISDGLQITQFYRIAGSQSDESIIYGGAQDNGTNKFNDGTWDKVMGGDGMECLVDYSDNDIVYATYQYGQIQKSVNGGGFFYAINPTLGSWLSPFVMHPTDNETLFAGYEDVYKTTNGGNTWYEISTKITGSSSTKLKSLAIAESDPLYIYTASSGQLYSSENGGSTWDNISSGLPVTAASISYLAIDPDNPKILWVSFSSFSDGNKVYKTTNRGITWQNVSGSLPNIPINCITYEKGSNNGLYIGTDLGVFYTNDSLSDWASYNDGLPNVPIFELEIQYASSKIRAATYGRGLWQSPLYNVVKDTSSLSIEAITPSFSIYPNPANEKVFIQGIFPKAETLKIELYNVIGAKVLTKEIQNGLGYTVKELNTSELNKGVYYLQINRDNEIVYSKRVILE